MKDDKMSMIEKRTERLWCGKGEEVLDVESLVACKMCGVDGNIRRAAKKSM